MIQAEMTQQTFDELAEKLRAEEGITLAGTSGKVTSHGETVDWSFQNGLLTMKSEAGFPLNHVVEAKLKDALKSNGVLPR